MVRLDVKRFQPGYKKPAPPRFASGEAFNTANLIVERVELAAERMEKFGEGQAVGNRVGITLENNQARHGYVLDGQCIADAKTGELASLEASVSKEGKVTSTLSYLKRANGQEVFEDSLYGKVIRSRDGLLLMDQDGKLAAQLY